MICYGRIAKIAAQLSNGLVNSAMGQIPCSTERISSFNCNFCDTFSDFTFVCAHYLVLIFSLLRSYIFLLVFVQFLAPF